MTDPDPIANRIVVAADGSEGSLAALDWAAHEAVLRGATLDIVHVWSTPVAFGPMGTAAYAFDPTEFEASAKERMEGLVRRVGETVTETVTVRPFVREGQPAHEVLAVARGADLLVVGTRGWGGFTGLLLGSVSQQLVHHAECPVVVIPPPERTEHAD